jgi:hypothetical protein
MEEEPLLSGPISISIDLVPYPLDSEELYRKELSILRNLAWLVIIPVLAFRLTRSTFLHG